MVDFASCTIAKKTTGNYLIVPRWDDRLLQDKQRCLSNTMFMPSEKTMVVCERKGEGGGGGKWQRKDRGGEGRGPALYQTYFVFYFDSLFCESNTLPYMHSWWRSRRSHQALRWTSQLVGCHSYESRLRGERMGDAAALVRSRTIG